MNKNLLYNQIMEKVAIQVKKALYENGEYDGDATSWDPTWIDSRDQLPKLNDPVLLKFPG